MRKIIQQLDNFLKYILSHPTLKSHEFIHEFLVLGEIDTDMVQKRTQMKMEYFEESARQRYEPFVHDLSSKLCRWEDEDLKLIVLQNSLRNISGAFKLLNLCQNQIYEATLLIQTAALNPNMCIFVKRSSIDSICTTFCRIWHLGIQHDRSEDFVEALNEITGARQTCEYLNLATSEHLKLRNHIGILGQDLSLLEGQALKKTNTASIQKLSNTYVDYAKASNKVEMQASTLNHTFARLDDEFSYFEQFRAEALIKIFDKYAANELESSEGKLNCIEILLDTFKN